MSLDWGTGVVGSKCQTLKHARRWWQIWLQYLPYRNYAFLPHGRLSVPALLNARFEISCDDPPDIVQLGLIFCNVRVYTA